jgi:hypothetical protein
VCRRAYAMRPGPGYARWLHRARAGFRQPPRQALLAARRVRRRCLCVRQTAALRGLEPVLDSSARSPPHQRCEGTGDRPVHSDLVDLRSSPISALNAARCAESADSPQVVPARWTVRLRAVIGPAMCGWSGRSSALRLPGPAFGLILSFAGGLGFGGMRPDVLDPSAGQGRRVLDASAGQPVRENVRRTGGRIARRWSSALPSEPDGPYGLADAGARPERRGLF